jgi:hypothetical protein
MRSWYLANGSFTCHTDFVMTIAAMADKKALMLPPLILHPFSDPEGPAKLVESSRASMMLQGLLPAGQLSQEDLDLTLINGRFCEIRMLYYVGKDLVRWIEQCMEMVDRNSDLRTQNFRFQSFAAYLVEDAPAPVRVKLKKWGVADYKAIFARAIGLNAVFAEVPEQGMLAPDFIRNYYKFADQMYAVVQHQSAFTRIPPQEFDFELYASGEYSRMLAKEWEQE